MPTKLTIKFLFLLLATLACCVSQSAPSENRDAANPSNGGGTNSEDPDTIVTVTMDDYDGPNFETCTGAQGFAAGGSSTTYYVAHQSWGEYLYHAWPEIEGDPTQMLNIEVYQGWGGLNSPGSPYYFGSEEASYADCYLCVSAYTDQGTFMPVSGWGVANINADSTSSSAVGQEFSGNLDVVLQEVTIDPASDETQVVDGGCQGRLKYEWGSTVEAYEPATCPDTNPDPSTIQSCAACLGEGGAYQSYAETHDTYGDVVYYYWLNDELMPSQWLDIAVYADGGLTQPGTYVFTENDETYDDCAVCVIAYVGEKAYMPKAGGSASIDAVAVGTGVEGQAFKGSLDVTMQEVTIADGTTEVVSGGCSGTLAFSWDAMISSPGQYTQRQ